jgi:hypothetical protein
VGCYGAEWVSDCVGEEGGGVSLNEEKAREEIM